MIELSFGEALRKIRKGRGLTLQAVADKAGLDHSGISVIERGRRDPSLKSLRGLARGLDVVIVIDRDGSVRIVPEVHA